MTRRHTPVCEDFRQRFGALLRDELDVEWRGRVKGHLLSCEACALAFGDVVAEAQVQHPVAVRALSRPPEPVLEAMGVQDRHGSYVWTELHALAVRGVEWAQQALTHVHDAFRTTFQSPILPQPAWADMGFDMDPQVIEASAAPVHAEVELLDASGQTCVGTRDFEILTPPTITSDGTFLLAMRTAANDLAGTTLHCTVNFGMRITFETALQRIPESHGWEAMVRAEGFPADEPVVIPPELIHLSLQME